MKEEEREWKINNWFMKTLFVLASIFGVLGAISFITGMIIGMLNP